MMEKIEIQWNLFWHLYFSIWKKFDYKRTPVDGISQRQRLWRGNTVFSQLEKTNTYLHTSYQRVALEKTEGNWCTQLIQAGSIPTGTSSHHLSDLFSWNFAVNVHASLPISSFYHPYNVFVCKFVSWHNLALRKQKLSVTCGYSAFLSEIFAYFFPLFISFPKLYSNDYPTMLLDQLNFIPIFNLLFQTHGAPPVGHYWAWFSWALYKTENHIHHITCTLTSICYKGEQFPFFSSGFLADLIVKLT